MKNVIIFGASGHGSVVLDCLEKEQKYNVIGFIDSLKKKGATHDGYEILGATFDLPDVIEKFNIIAGIVAIGDNWNRKLVVDRVRKIVPDFRFISAVHPKATLGKNVVIGSGSVIMPGVIINTNSVVGDFCLLNTNSSLDHDGRMCDFSSLAPGVITGGNFLLGKYSAVSLGSNIIENISIGSHTIIGAGSLVIMDIPNYVMVHGTPANIVRKRKQGEKYLTGTKFTSSRVYISNYL